MADGNTSKRSKMTEEELLSIIKAHEQTAMGNSTSIGMMQAPANPSNMTTLELDNYNALNAYYARPRGDELPDRSQIITPELRDTIEWIKPQLMRMFAGTSTIVRFEADGPNDEELAQQQTDACNYIFMRQNNGVLILHDYIMDALLLRNGYTKVYYESKRSVKIENYTGLDETALAQLFEDAEEDGDEIEILGQQERTEMIMGPLPMPEPSAPTPPAPGAAPTAGGITPSQPPMPSAPAMGLIPQTVFDLKLRRVSTQPRVCVDAVPREEVLVSPRARSGLDEAPFYEHKTKISRSELIAEGYDADLVNDAQIGPPRWTNIDDQARNDLLDQTQTDDSLDPAMQEPEVRDVHLRVDWDGDGIAELRRVVIIGDKIAENEEEEEGPISSGSPMRMAHRHIGISLYELLIDIQNEKTTLVRSLNDNVHLQNNTQLAIDQDNVNIEDMMTSRPGGLKRVKGSPMDKIMPLEVPNVIGDVMGAINYWDQERQWRTGVGTDTTVLDADALQDVTKGGTMALLSKSDLKIELMARLLAEGLKDTFRKINNCIIRHQDKPMMMKLREKWVEIDPSTWKTRTSVTINVGLGSGNREEQRQSLVLLGNLMQTAKGAGMVSPKNAYTFFKRSIEALNFSSPEEFLTDPNTPEGLMLQKALQQPPWQVAVANIKAQAQNQQNQRKAQLDAQQSLLDHKLQLKQITAEQYSESMKTLAQQRAESDKLALDHQGNQDEIILNAIVKLVSSALMAKAPAEQIPEDVSAARSAMT